VKMMKKIITHNGNAHMDEFLSIVLILGYDQDNDYEIVRVPRLKGLYENFEYVIDIGDIYDPEHKFFDGHAAKTSSFKLIAQHLGFEEYFVDKLWYHFLNISDAYGPKKATELLGLPTKFEFTYDILQRGILNMFADTNYINQDTLIYRVMKAIGTNFVNGIKIIEYAKQYIEENQKVYQCNGYTMTILDDIYLDGANAAFKLLRHKYNYSITISIEQRTGNYGIYRYDDFEEINFNVIADEKEVEYVHHNGFYCVVNINTERARLLSLISKVLNCPFKF